GGQPENLGLTTEQLLSQVEIPVRDRLALARRLKLSDTPIPSVVNPVTPVYRLGEQHSFCVLDSDAVRYTWTTATLRHIGNHSYWWVEDGHYVRDEAITISAQEFEQRIYPTNRDFFGGEWSPGVDNDPRIHIFLGDVPGVSGYFYSANEYSRLINPCSNEKEMFYININAVPPGSEDLHITLAHEFQHMIHWHHDANEETWVNEGLSNLAVELNGYETSDITHAFSQRPDTQLNTWAEAPQDTFPHYAASYLFMSYFRERFGEAIMRAVVAEPENGIAGFNAVLARARQPYRFTDIFADWVIANYLDDPAAGHGKWGYHRLNPQPVKTEAEYSAYPVEISGQVGQYATDYFTFAGQGDLTIEFEGAPYVKIAPNEPHSGLFQWWSNRGDDSDMTLTRSFDLSHVSEATLEFWLWYDIEAGWDFAYVQVSEDGGQTWTILPGRYTSAENPSGNSFGAAWTGISGGGETPEWVHEQVDLTPYVGRQIQVRFEYITDDAVNRVGLMLDDIAIPQIGYLDDVETGDGGWVAHGFVRVDNILPQRYLVQVIQKGDTVQVQRMPLDKANRGRLTLCGMGETFYEAVLAISGVTPFTTEPAPYHIRASLTLPSEETRN
ncbi:MAG: immune inhibitor A, partial [Anaerolineae bacterium]|nr:immune inhibitor A [Anaerolineae bacterium]